MESLYNKHKFESIYDSKPVEEDLAPKYFTKSSHYFNNGVRLQDTLFWEIIPKSPQDWTNFMVHRLAQKAGLKYTDERDIEKVMKRYRAVLKAEDLRKKKIIDPDLPECYHWDTNRVAEWIASKGFPEVKTMFLLNHINGRKLVTVDATVLNRMGMTDLKRMQQVTKIIRSLLQIPPPNFLRGIFRLVPIEHFLQMKSKTGAKIDAMTFKSFCEEYGFNYEALKINKTASIPPTCEVEIKALQMSETPDETSSSSGSQDSLKICPTVEYIARHIPQREVCIENILNYVIRIVFKILAEKDASEKMLQGQIDSLLQDVCQGMSKKECISFISELAKEFVNDLLRSREIIDDLDKFKTYMRNFVPPQKIKDAQQAASTIFDRICVAASMLKMGDLKLENLIREAPGVRNFIGDIIKDAEDRVSNILNPSLDSLDTSSSSMEATIWDLLEE